MKRHENKRNINSGYMIAVNEYCRTDKDISSCRAKLGHEIFRHEWSVGWFRDQELVMALPMFNQTFFKEALRKFYMDAYDSIRRFNFVGIYVVKDIEAWLLEVGQQQQCDTTTHRDELLSTMPDASLRVDTSLEDSPLVHYDAIERQTEVETIEKEMTQLRENILRDMPFGVIPMALCETEMYGHYVLIEDRLKMQKSLVFECNDEERAARYNFRVMDFGAEFKFPNTKEDREAGLHVSYGYNELVPISPFVELMRHKERIREAELALFDANSMLTYRDGYMIAKPLPLSQTDAISEANLYAFDDLLEARQADSIRQQDLAMNNAHSQMHRLNMRRSIQAASSGHHNTGARCTPFAKGGANPVSWERRIQYDRPSANETLEYIPQSVEIPAMPSPAPIINVDALITKYELDVCTVMNLPYVFFKPHTADTSDHHGSKGHTTKNARMGTTSHNDMYQKLLESEVQNQQATFCTLFKEIYSQTFRRLDCQVNPSLRSDVEPSILFMNTIVKSDEAIRYLLPFYEAGLIPGVEIRRFLYKNYDIKIAPEIEPESLAKRKNVKAKRQLTLQNDDILIETHSDDEKESY